MLRTNCVVIPCTGSARTGWGWLLGLLAPPASAKGVAPSNLPTTEIATTSPSMSRTGLSERWRCNL